jgi:hypothetical protein
MAEFLADASVLPDLHRLAAAWARIAVAGDDDGLFSLPPPVQLLSATEPLMQGYQHMRLALASQFRRTGNASSRRGNLRHLFQLEGGALDAW